MLKVKVTEKPAKLERKQTITSEIRIGYQFLGLAEESTTLALNTQNEVVSLERVEEEDCYLAVSD